MSDLLPATREEELAKARENGFTHIVDELVEGWSVSTVLLPFMHLGGIYETCIFGGEFSEVVQRYRTHQEAVDGHISWTKKLTEALSSPDVLKKVLSIEE